MRETNDAYGSKRRTHTVRWQSTINFQFSVVEQRMHEQWTCSVCLRCASVWFRLELTVCSINSILIGSPRCAQLNDLCAREQHSTVTTAVRMCARATHAHQWINALAFANHTFDVLRTRSLAVCVRIYVKIAFFAIHEYKNNRKYFV